MKMMVSMTLIYFRNLFGGSMLNLRGVNYCKLRKFQGISTTSTVDR